MQDHKHGKKEKDRLEDVWGAWMGFVITTIVMLVLSFALFHGWQFWMWFVEMGTLIGGIVTTIEYFTKYTKLCPKCNSRVTTNAEFCKTCGEKISGNCAKCGAPSTGRFCEKCGHDSLIPYNPENTQIITNNIVQDQNINAQSPEFCPMCGNGLGSDASFCAVCGAKIAA